MIQTHKGKYIDILNQRIFPAKIKVQNGIIIEINACNDAPDRYILPGFIDAHVHVESSLLAPSEFARMALTHGTIASISDPHEIANVLGMQGVEYMIENGKQVPFYFYFGAPSCVPATVFETAGAKITVNEVKELLANPAIFYLSEMMNFPGVLAGDEEVMQKISAAHAAGKPVDGHAPALRGKSLQRYVAAGISTDHECFTLEEAAEKLKLGMKVLIREGSAAKNFDALIPLLDTYYAQIMFCSDDKHPDSLLLGHINVLVKRALEAGCNLFKVLQVACLNPAMHYKTKHGLLQVGDAADFIVVNNLQDWQVLQTFIRGNLVAETGETCCPYIEPICLNNFLAEPISLEDLAHLPRAIEPVIVCIDGQLITESKAIKRMDCTPQNDCLKLVVVNRYTNAKPAIAYVKNFGLTQGAIASSVAHDSHNIIAVGYSDADILKAVNIVIAEKGALVACNEKEQIVLPLPIAGLMSNLDAWQVAQKYTHLDRFSKEVLGSSLTAPLMSLSFMALLVIPHLKLSDLGLFNGDNFAFVERD